MKITGRGASGSTAASRASAKKGDSTASHAAPAAAAPAELQSAVLQPALDALGAMPDVDHAKVSAIRDALARGEVTFDPARLAALIERFHRGHD